MTTQIRSLRDYIGLRFVSHLTRVFIMVMSFLLKACSSLINEGHQDSPNYQDGRFYNAKQSQQPGLWQSLVLSWRFLTKNLPDSRPVNLIEVEPLRRDALLAAADNSLWRLGHSTVLLKLDGKFWLTDPVFSERASSLCYFGPKRFHPLPLRLDEVPPIEAVILSHDHYDHLDKASILSLSPSVRLFLAPLGVGERLIAWGVPASKVKQLDWWQQENVGSVRLIATPAQHFSGRSIGDSNRTLWASWAIIAPELKLFFSGDTGYFDGFKEIGKQFGPFDVTLIEAGAYDSAWPDTHMTPEESVQAHFDLQGRWMLPIHNGTFDLAFHSWTEPFVRVLAASRVHGVSVLTPRFGERINLTGPEPTTNWWQAGSAGKY